MQLSTIYATPTQQILTGHHSRPIIAAAYRLVRDAQASFVVKHEMVHIWARSRCVKRR